MSSGRGSIEEVRRLIEERVKGVKHRIIVMSGKGGVGKTMVVVNLADMLCMKGYKVSILDCDIHGPSVPKMLGVSRGELLVDGGSIRPLKARNGIEVVSMDFLLPNEDTPVIWRGPLKARAIMEFLSQVDWGDRDFLLVDLPPGTGDEPLSIVQLMPKMDGTIIVTIPSKVSEHVVRKAVSFVRRLKLPLLGIVENMSYFICPKCGSRYEIFGKGGGGRVARDMGTRLLASIPLDPRLSEACDEGFSFLSKYPNSDVYKAFDELASVILKIIQEGKG